MSMTDARSALVKPLAPAKSSISTRWSSLSRPEELDFDRLNQRDTSGAKMGRQRPASVA